MDIGEEVVCSKQVIITIEDRVGIITLNRPPRNAFSSTLFCQLHEGFEKLDKDDGVHVIVITGGIRNCFASGADLEELFSQGTANDLIKGDYKGFFGVQRAFKDIACSPKPVIAAINGVCIAGGLELALACDLRVASELSYFSLPEVAQKIIPGIGGIQRLTRLIGPGRAKQMLMLGKMVRSGEALEWGLVNWVVPAKDVLPTAMEKARELAQAPPNILASIKELVHVAQEEKSEDAMKLEVESFVEVLKQKLLPRE